jgi:hypothetical protein
VDFLTFLITEVLFLANPDTLLAIGSAKVAGFSGVTRERQQLLCRAAVARAILKERVIWNQGLRWSKIFATF